jgi:enoyl-CoA hydratase/carnithine racemase
MAATATLAPKHFGWKVDDRVAIVTLNRPDKKNPLTFESYAELRDTFRALAGSKDVRAVVVTGAGGNFCSGGDVNEIIGPLVAMALPKLRQFTQMTGDLIKAMRACPQPVIAAIDGVCAGAGACVAMAADLRIGTPRSTVAFLFTRVGLAGCDMGACSILPRIIGQGRASELLYTGRAMTAEEALAWGFYNRLVAPEALLADAHAFAASLAHGPTAAHAVTKRMLHLEWSMAVDAAIDAEAKAQADLMTGKDFARAYHAFVKKERPKFEGD